MGKGIKFLIGAGILAVIGVALCFVKPYKFKKHSRICYVDDLK